MKAEIWIYLRTGHCTQSIKVGIVS